jgi:hypothetical protein
MSDSNYYVLGVQIADVFGHVDNSGVNYGAFIYGLNWANDGNMACMEDAWSSDFDDAQYIYDNTWIEVNRNVGTSTVLESYTINYVETKHDALLTETNFLVPSSATDPCEIYLEIEFLDD